MLRILSVIFILIAGHTILMGMEDERLNLISRRNQTTNLVLMAGLPLCLNSYDFSDDYTKYIGGHSTDFKTTPLLSFSLKIPVNSNLQTSFTYDYFHSSFSDFFPEYFVLLGKTVVRWMGESISISSMPILAGIEYVPLELPYKSYLGISAGASISDISWEETVNTLAEADPRNGGHLVSEKSINPCWRITSGIEFDFDRTSDREFLNSFIAEARFTYTYRYVQLFENLKGEDKKFDEISQNKYSVLPFYIGLYLGLSLNIGYL